MPRSGRGLCDRDEWHNRQGRLCAASARKALPQLAAELLSGGGLRGAGVLISVAAPLRLGPRGQRPGWDARRCGRNIAGIVAAS